MSGIAGIYYLDHRPVDRADLEKMVNILAHRGPDGHDLWQGGSVGLGHCMLWTTPESLHEKLPLMNRAGDLVITADARIDNRNELLAALDLSDRADNDISDSQLILAAYQKWGERCPERLLGDFAFAIWDEHRQQLFCARDHFGVRPFYYYQSDRVFIFASEIKALLCLTEVPCRLNEVRVGDYLATMLEDRAITFYQDIFRLPPANTLKVSREGIQIHSYWSLDASNELKLSSDDEYVEGFRDLFTEAVRCRLRSAFPVGSMLSGGLDSSSVTCVARRTLVQEAKDELHTFSFIFGDVPQCDERNFIYSVLEGGDVVFHFVAGDQHSPLVDSDLVLWHQDEAFLGPNLYLPWSLNRAVHEAGVRVLLGGFDGDTTVSHGVSYLNELAYVGQWAAFATQAKQLASRVQGNALTIFRNFGAPSLQELARGWRWVAFAKGADDITRHFDIARRRVWWQHGIKPLAPNSVRRGWRRLRGRDEPESDIVSRSFARRIGLKARVHALAGARSNPPRTLREDQWRTLTTGGLPYLLELSDRAATAFSIEFRHPFMDKRLVEFCLALPPEQRLHQGWTRWILRRAMGGILPEQVRWRTNKASFHDNFVHTLLTFERERLDQLFLADSDVLADYVDIRAVRRAYQRLTTRGKATSDDVIAVWKASNLALWLRYTGLSPS